MMNIRKSSIDIMIIGQVVRQITNINNRYMIGPWPEARFRPCKPFVSLDPGIDTRDSRRSTLRADWRAGSVDGSRAGTFQRRELADGQRLDRGTNSVMNS